MYADDIHSSICDCSADSRTYMHASSSFQSPEGPATKRARLEGDFVFLNSQSSASHDAQIFDPPPSEGNFIHDNGSSDNIIHIPFGGDFSGFAWNAQALFAQKASRQVRKRYRALELIKTHDFGCISETHGLLGRQDALWLPQGVEALWSHGSSRIGGVGLWIKTKFLEQFTEQSWVEVEPGRVAKLQLRGESGGLDLFCCYLDTNSSYNRQQSITRMSRHIQPNDKVLTVITGDFNFVEADEDRWNMDGGTFSGSNNLNGHDASVFKSLLRDMHGIHEWAQPFFTCDAGGARSRIDRMYCNQHITYQLDRHCSCSALE